MIWTVREHLLTTQGWFLSAVYTHIPMLKWRNLFILDAKKKKKKKLKKKNLKKKKKKFKNYKKKKKKKKKIQE